MPISSTRTATSASVCQPHTAPRYTSGNSLAFSPNTLVLLLTVPHTLSCSSRAMYTTTHLHREQHKCDITLTRSHL